MARSIAGRRVLRHRRRLRGQRRALLRVCPVPDAVGAASYPLRRSRVGVADDVLAHRGCSEDCCRCRDNRGSDDCDEPAAAVGEPHASDDRDKPRRCASDRRAAARSRDALPARSCYSARPRAGAREPGDGSCCPASTGRGHRSLQACHRAGIRRRRSRRETRECLVASGQGARGGGALSARDRSGKRVGRDLWCALFPPGLSPGRT